MWGQGPRPPLKFQKRIGYTSNKKVLWTFLFVFKHWSSVRNCWKHQGELCYETEASKKGYVVVVHG